MYLQLGEYRVVGRPMVPRGLGARYALYVLNTPGDGHCFLHSILLAFSSKYRQDMGDKRKALELVVALRKELSDKMGSPHPDGGTYYDHINDGNTAKYAAEWNDALDKEYGCCTLQRMQEVLASNKHMGTGYLDYFGNMFNKDIYIVSETTGELYYSFEYEYSIKGNRNSIVILHTGERSIGHYEPIMLEGSSYFTPDVPLIKDLYAQVQAALEKARAK